MKFKAYKKILILALFSIFFSLASYSNSSESNMVLVKGSKFIPPFTLEKNFKEFKIKSFLIDKYPVTKKEYLNFIKNNPKWQKDKIPSVFADDSYLSDWSSSLSIDTKKYNEPVTYVSWFSAKAYCNSKQKRLPTTLEWEFASYEEKSEDLDWYWKPQVKNIPSVGKNNSNSKGINDFHNLVWELTYDFNNSVINEDNREISGAIQKVDAFCGGTGNFKDKKDYPAFARYSFRSTLKSDTTLNSLGFRCAKDL